MIQIALFLLGVATVFFGFLESAGSGSSLNTLSDSLGIVIVSPGSNGAILWVGGWIMIGLSGVIGIIWRVVNILTRLETKLSDMREQIASPPRRVVSTATGGTAARPMESESAHIAALQAKYDKPSKVSAEWRKTPEAKLALGVAVIVVALLLLDYFSK